MMKRTMWCDICNEEATEWYEVPCQYKYFYRNRIHKNRKEKRYICVNCWMAIQGIVQKERGLNATYEEIYRMGVDNWNKEWERTHKLVHNEDGTVRLVFTDEVSE